MDVQRLLREAVARDAAPGCRDHTGEDGGPDGAEVTVFKRGFDAIDRLAAGLDRDLGAGDRACSWPDDGQAGKPARHSAQPGQNGGRTGVERVCCSDHRRSAGGRSSHLHNRRCVCDGVV